eukprot:7058640-Pyramimonas_sp.AAC.1
MISNRGECLPCVSGCAATAETLAYTGLDIDSRLDGAHEGREYSESGSDIQTKFAVWDTIV